MQRHGWSLGETLFMVAIILILCVTLWPLFTGALKNHRKNTKISCVWCLPTYTQPRNC